MPRRGVELSRVRVERGGMRGMKRRGEEEGNCESLKKRLSSQGVDASWFGMLSSLCEVVGYVSWERRKWIGEGRRKELGVESCVVCVSLGFENRSLLHPRMPLLLMLLLLLLPMNCHHLLKTKKRLNGDSEPVSNTNRIVS